MTTIETQRRDRGALESELQAVGATIRGKAIRCPFHDDRHASGSIHQDGEGVWRFTCHCSECGFSGDLFDVRAQATGRALEDVLRSESDGTPRPRKERVYSIEDLRLAVSRDGEIEAEYAYTNPDTNKPNMLVFRLRTPQGKTFRQASPVPGGWVQRAPAKPWPLYNRKRVRQADTVVVVEGEKCVHALHDIGVIGTTAPCGAGKAEHADWSILAGKRIALWPDGDVAGKNHIAQVALILERLEPAPQVSIIEPADLDLGEKEDAADFIQQCRTVGDDPAQAVRDVLTKARPQGVSQGLQKRLAGMIDGTLAAIAWPWPEVSRLTRALMPQTVTILCGTPGATKSFALLQALAYWHEEGIKVAVFELEKDRGYHLHRVLAQREGNSDLQDPDWLKANATEGMAAYDRHRDFLDGFGRAIWDAPHRQATLPELAAWVQQRADGGCRIIAVDPISMAAANERPWVADSEFLAVCERTVESANVSLILVTHPRKGTKGGVGLDDLAGGAAYQRASDTILWLEYLKKTKTATASVKTGAGTDRRQAEINRIVHVCKARNGIGAHLAVGCWFDGRTLLLNERGVIVKDDEGT